MNIWTGPNRLKSTAFVALILAFIVFSNAALLFAAAPTVTTGSASSITRTTAILSGTILDNGGSTVTDSGFEYGTSTSYGTTISGSVGYGTYLTFPTVWDGGGGPTPQGDPYHVDLASNGDIYVSFGKVASRFDSTGNFLNNIGTDKGSFGEQSGVALDSSDNIFVSVYDTFALPPFEIQKYNASGVLQTSFGSIGTAEAQFVTPDGLATDASGNIYVADFDNNRIQKFNSAGVFQFMFGWGVDTGANTFEVCTSGCQAGAVNGNQNGRFAGPKGLAVDASGNIYVADSGNDRIQKFNSSGIWQLNIGTSGSGNGNLDNPNDVDIDSNGNIYIADFGNNRVEKFDSSGAFVTSVTGVVASSAPTGVAVDSDGLIYIVESGLDRVKVVATSLTTSPAISGLLCGTTYHFRAFATNADGTSYGSDQTFTTSACDTPVVQSTGAADVGRTGVVLTGVQTSDGATASTVRGFEYGTTVSYGTTINFNGASSLSRTNQGTGGVAEGEYSSPMGIIQGLDGTIYVADTLNSRVQVFDSSGAFIRTFGWGVATGASALEVCTSSCQDGLAGSGIGQFMSPRGVGIDNATGDIYVADTGNSRIQKFNSAGSWLQTYGTGTPGTGPGEFDSPVDIEIQSTGGSVFMYVVDSGDNLGHPRVQKLNGSGVMIDAVGDFGSNPGQFNSPRAITGNGGQYLYVADAFNARIQVINRTTMEASVVQFAEPVGWNPNSAIAGVAIDFDNNLYLSDPNNSRIIFAVQEADASHYRFVSEFTGMSDPGSLMVDSSLIVRALDTSSGFVSVLSPFFSYELKPLACNTIYHYRAFATNSDGTGYGDDTTFTTLPCSSGTSGSGGGGGPPPPPVYGCVDPGATNYNPAANESDDSCVFPPDYFGCTDPFANNYNSAAQADDGSCDYSVGPTPVYGCTNPIATNYNPAANTDDGSCTIGGGGGPIEPPPPDDVLGCTDSYATNYDSTATVDDGSCDYTITPPPPPDWWPPSIDPVIDGITGFIEKETGLPPEKQADIAKAVAVAGLVVPSIWILLADRAALVSIPLRLWNLIPTLLGFRRKRRPWGTVYDSVTKQPLDPVYVRLYDQAFTEVATSITDLDGRYGFAPTPGAYTIDAKKADYVFPSQKLSGADHDELYADLYFGGPITVESDDTIITKNIPMDAVNFNWNEFEKAKRAGIMKFYSKGELFLSRIARILFIAGFAASVFLVALEPRTLNFVILGIYIFIFVLSLFGVRPKKPGYVVERASGAPLSFAILSVFSAALQREVGHTVVGATGRYHILVPKGRYYVTLKKKTGEQTYEDVFTSDVFRAKKGYIDKVIKV